MTFQPEVAPLGSLWLSAVVALAPLVMMFLSLGILKWKAHWAGAASLVVAMLVATLAFKMPVSLTFLAATQGAVFGIFPIVWIVVTAIWLYQVTVVSGRFEDLRSTFGLVSEDPRVLAILVAFCFGGLLEALAGFGAPVAITAVMLTTIGFSSMKAATVVLVANTAPVAFGAVGTPIIAAGTLSGVDYHTIGAMAGHQTPILSIFVPFILIFIADGKRGFKQAWPAALVIGFSFAVAKWISATYISVELTDVIASLFSLGIGVVFLRFWKASGSKEAMERLRNEPGHVNVKKCSTNTSILSEPKLSAGRVFMALLPYLLVVIIFTVAKLVPVVVNWLKSTDLDIKWPRLYGKLLTIQGKPSHDAIFNFAWLSGPGTLLVITTILVTIFYKVSARDAIKAFGSICYKMRWSALTILCVLALAYVMNMSGQTIAVGAWIAGVGPAFAFFSPVLGWIGTAVTGSDTSANALFSKLQQTTAVQTGLNPVLLVAANTSGGVVGKLISPQNLAIGATSVGLTGSESKLLRNVMPWSLGMLLFMCVLVYLQSTILTWL